MEGGDFTAELVERALTAGADDAQVTTTGFDRFEIDFSQRKVDLLRSTTNETTSIMVVADGKRGSASLNGRDPDAVEAALEAARQAAMAGLVDPANRVAEAASLPASRHGPDAPDREAMIEQVMACTQELNARYPLIRTRNSIYTFLVKEAHFANSRGLRQQERRAWYQFGGMFTAKDGPRTTSFNYSGAASYVPFEQLLSAGSVRPLIEQTLRSFDARPVPEKFVGDVILTPDCLGYFVPVLARALNGYELLSGTSPYKDKKGETIASPLFSLLNRPRNTAFPEGCDFDGFGIPTRDVEVVKDGRLENHLVDFYIAHKLGLAQTAGVWNFVVPPGDKSLDEIVAGTRRGIILARFSGGNPNSNLDFSGVAKNSFYVEDGTIRHALTETMVSGNLQALLRNIHAVSREHVNFGDHDYPNIAASGVTISAK
ncbi:MAG: TldD/PmbA family protein [Alphaproteobacteria bacterium]|nr:TldD/PmbA family protein [Alphaproteobacteria bacterium]